MVWLKSPESQHCNCIKKDGQECVDVFCRQFDISLNAGIDIYSIDGMVEKP